MNHPITLSLTIIFFHSSSSQKSLMPVPERALFQCNPFDVPLTWANCPFDDEKGEGDLAANVNICEVSTCPCSESFTPKDCVLGLGEKVEQD
jgi:hypothetical protein